MISRFVGSVDDQAETSNSAGNDSGSMINGMRNDATVTKMDAAKQALREMIALIQEKSNLSKEDAYTLCSIAADLRVSQIVNVHKGIHVMLAKSALHG